jgi:type IV pilus assembly protein PilC
MLIFVVPVFTKMFSSMGGQLPAPTRVLVAMSSGAKFGVPALIVGSIVFSTWYRKHKDDDRVRRIRDPLKLKLPIFGELFRKVAIARFARNLGTMMHSGVPILQSLEIVSDATGNIVLETAIKDVQESVRSGESLTRPLAQHEVFPPMVVQMMAVGEDTGALDAMLHKIAEFYDEEVKTTTETLTSLIEPLMIAVLGGIIGSMIVALYMPIFKLMDLVK